jgi:hypothetical protein
MKSNLVCAALACAALAITSTAAMALNNPIPGVDIIITKCYPCHYVLAVHPSPSDQNGKIDLRGLEPGDYVIEIDGKSLDAALDKLAPLPKKKSGGSSFSLGFGGFSSGGGSSHRHASQEGAGPIGGGPTKGSHDNSASGGGTEAGVNVAVGDLNGDGPPDSVVRPGNQGNQQGTVTYTVTVTGSSDPTGEIHKSGTGQVIFSSETPYRSGTASKDTSLKFKISDNESPRPQDSRLMPGDIAEPAEDVTFTVTFGGSLAGSPRSH